MKKDFPCKYCTAQHCEDCPHMRLRESIETFVLREVISGLSEADKIPFIEGILREEGLEAI